MGPLVGMIDSLMLSSTDVAALAVLLIFLPLFVLFTVRAKSGRRFPLRPIPAYTRLRQLVSQATESGLPIHVGMGSGQLGSEATAEALMGLTTFDYVARHAAAGNQGILGTTGDATILPAAQGILQAARQEAGFPERYTGREVNFYGSHPLAYANGAQDAMGREEHLANVLIGRFGSEGLWLAEGAEAHGMAQLGGTSDPSSAALLHTAVDASLIGEEVYAAGAYLHRPSHLGSLAAQDVLRMVIILAIIVGAVLTSLGYWQ